MQYPKVVLVKNEDEPGTVRIDEARLVHTTFSADFCIRVVGKLTCKAIWLNSLYDWMIAKDENGELLAIPLKKL
jgi:hypothetical protein